MSTVGLAFIDPANFATWNVSGKSTVAAIGGAMALCLFSYIGVESASVAAGQVREPKRNIPRATILGTLAAALVYLLSLVTVLGTVPNAELASSTAPFATAATDMTGASWVGALVAIVVVISGFGALNGWTMLSAEMPRAAARDGLFPSAFERMSRRGVPAVGIIISGVLATILVLLSHIGATGVAVFNTLILMIGIAAAIPYGFSALAQIKWRIADRRTIARSRLARDLITAAVSLIFSMLFVVLLDQHRSHRVRGLRTVRLPRRRVASRRSGLSCQPIPDDGSAASASGEPSLAALVEGAAAVRGTARDSHRWGRPTSVSGMDNRNEVREFLASRRAKVTPDQAGLPRFGGQRRVPGLRRGEVAMLAERQQRGTTPAWSGATSAGCRTACLGQSRPRCDSPRPNATLFDLARAAGGPTKRRSAKQSMPIGVRPVVQRLLDAMTEAPAFVRNARLDFLAANALGYALYSEVFVDPAVPRISRGSPFWTRVPKRSTPTGRLRRTTRSRCFGRRLVATPTTKV